MRIALTAVVFVVLMMSGEKPKTKTNADAGNAGQPQQQTVTVVSQQLSQGEQADHAQKRPSYLARLFSPENLPNITLVIVAAITALFILGQAKEMKSATDVMRGQLKAMQDQLGQMDSSGRQADKMVEHASHQVAAIQRQAELMRSAGAHTETLAAQAVKQSDLTQRQFDLTNRPWISIDFVKPISNLEFRDGGDCLVWFAYQIKNVGNSVAQHIIPWIEPIVNGLGDPAEVRTRISTQLKRPVDSPFDHGKLIFPNQVITDRYPLMIRPSDLANALDKSPFKAQDGSTIRAIGLELFVCFDYQSTLDPSEHYQTQSMYLLGYRGNGMFLASQKIYGMDGLGLVFKGFGAYAD